MKDINELELALAADLEPPKGIMVNPTLFEQLFSLGRLTKRRGFPDLGFKFWSLDQSIFVWIDPTLEVPFNKTL